MDEVTRTQRSKMLSAWLRHKPERGGLTLSKEGWAAIPAILEAFERNGHTVSRAEFDDLIRLDVKGRFEAESDRVRARYGHSIELEEKPHPRNAAHHTFHGTARRFLPRILQSGLKPMKRQFVHLSPDKSTARTVGRRRDQEPAILIISAHQAHEAGIQFYPRGKGIWLSDPIPPEYLTVLEESPAPTPNTQEAGSGVRTPRQSAPGKPRRRRPKGGFMKF